MSNIDLNKYKEFVQGVTSTASNETVELCNRLEALENHEIQQALIPIYIYLGIGYGRGPLYPPPNIIIITKEDIQEKNLCKIPMQKVDLKN